MVALRPLKPLKPLQPIASTRTPQQQNAARLSVLANQPPQRIAPQPVPHTLYAVYTDQLEGVADRSYRIGDSTVIAAVRRQQALAESYEARQKQDAADDPDVDEMPPAQRAAFQNKPHTPAQKRQLSLPFPLIVAIEQMNKRLVEYERTIPIGTFTTKQAAKVETFAASVNVRMLQGLGLQAIEPKSAIADMRDVWVRENAALIRSQPKEVGQRIGQKVREMVEGGSRWETIAKELEAEHGIATNRARLIARDQTSKYNGALNQAYQTEAGITHYQWQGAMDARERPTHVAVQGMVFAWTDPPPMGHPGEDYQCLPGDSEIQIAHFPTKAWRRWYAGELTEIVTDGGKVVQCTPNHPVLTGSGWKPAKLVDVGDKLFCDGWPHVGAVLPGQIQRDKPTIKQVFGALAEIGILTRQPARAVDFHGDATEAQQIDVVALDWSLCDHVDAQATQLAGEILLSAADMRLSCETRCDDLFNVLLALGLPSHGIVRGLSQLLAVCLAGVGHANEHGIGPTARGLSPTNQHSGNGSALNAVSLCQSLDALAGTVASDALRFIKWLCIGRRAVGSLINEPNLAHLDAENIGAAIHGDGSLGQSHPLINEVGCAVDKVGRVEFSGHVYNLETATGWYCSNVIVHNCRCSAIPVIAKDAIAKSTSLSESELSQKVEALGPQVKGGKPL
jgi:SPP1 gp7 family putative phage head morphogenesis protein